MCSFILIKTLFIKLIAIFAVTACSAGVGNVPFLEIIPYPEKVETSDGVFCAKGARIVCDDDMDSLSCAYVGKFAADLADVSGTSGSRTKIVFEKDRALASEHYNLEITPRKAVVRASDLNGFVYAVQTLKQMMPVEIYGCATAPEADWNLPCCKVSDGPRFGYRGMLLDVARYFFTVDEVKKFIDMMEILKMNVFHWHLTDDQGWRIEIRKYPELTETGSKRRETLVGGYMSGFLKRMPQSQLYI